MLEAGEVYITHAHVDHVMAVARHPDPSALAPRLRVNAAQLANLGDFAVGGELAPALSSIAPLTLKGPALVAPGVVVIPTPGHSAGSTSIYIMLENGDEYLLIGDIVWSMSNIENLRTRPRILQYIFFDPREDRSAVLRQVLELHEVANSFPDLVIVPSHDGAYLTRLEASGLLARGFKLGS